MKVLILDTYYPRFLAGLYEETPSIASWPYAEQHAHLMAQSFGTADFYSTRLREQGVEAIDIVGNCLPLQRQWALEAGVSIPRFSVRRLRSWVIRWLRRRGSRVALEGHDAEHIVLSQLRAHRPDVLYCQDLSFLSPRALQEARGHARLIVGQIASPLPQAEKLRAYDLILTSFPHYVSRLRVLGIASEHFRLGFDPRVLERLGRPPRTRPVTFVGGVSSAHPKRIALLETLARRLPLEVFGYGVGDLPPGSPIREGHRGEVWGLATYRALLESQITVNVHIDVAENFANNMRLYEATGCGALLLTDAKDNLGELFRVGEEVLAYRDSDELVALLGRYLADAAARERIARAGQARTLAEHTYERRMRELVPILEEALAAGRGALKGTSA
ncbi:glycosyltransferase [bacterium]|nr:glycosyltransferase [bacterium]